MGKACILIKSGRNMEGVIIISEMFLESVREYLPVLRKSNEVDPERKQKIHAQLKAVLDTCHK
jgi:C4-type Zn-finger protein